MIMKKNEETLKFNTENLATNEKFLKGEFHPSKATDKDNKKRIDQNTKRCAKIEEMASYNQKRIIEVQSRTQTNAIDIMKNSTSGIIECLAQNSTIFFIASGPPTGLAETEFCPLNM